MFDLSPFKIVIVIAVIMILMGPDKLPEVAQKLGASWRALKNLQERVESEVRSAIPDLPSTGDIARLARSPVNLLNQLADRVDAKETVTSTSAEDLEAEFDPGLLSRPPASPLRRRELAPDTPRGVAIPPDPSLN